MSSFWPRRNLGNAEMWGREVERREGKLRTAFSVRDAGLQGSSRYFASSAQEMSLRNVQIRDALNAVPLPISDSVTTSAYSVTNTWATVLSAEVEVPSSATGVNLAAFGFAQFDEAESSGIAQFQWPFDPSTITSEYGMRFDPVTGVWSMHNGIDFSFTGILGTNVVAPGTGTVEFTGFQVERGNWVQLVHPGGLRTRYYHLQFPSPLSPGTAVTKGVTVIGQVGNTGASTGPHLHWETLVNATTRMNPRDFMALYGTTTGGIAQRVFGRVVIDGVPGPELTFPPVQGSGTSSAPRQWTRPLFSLTWTPPPGILLIALQLRSSVGPVEMVNTPLATLTLTGSITRG